MIRVIGPERLARWLPLAAFSVRRQEQITLLAIVMLSIAIYFGIMYLVGGVGKEEFALCVPAELTRARGQRRSKVQSQMRLTGRFPPKKS